MTKKTFENAQLYIVTLRYNFIRSSWNHSAWQ